MQLALETSTNICSVAFRDAGGRVYEKRTEARGSHSEKLFLFIEELMREHGFKSGELETVIVSEGPGSYTGLRISASAVKGLLFQSDITLYGANTLASFAVSAMEAGTESKTIHAVIDARRVHLYHQQFQQKSGQLITKGEVEVLPIEQFEKVVKSGDTVIGTGLDRIDRNILDKTKIFDLSYISARSLLKLIERDVKQQFIHQADPKRFEPRYYTSNQV